MLSTRAPLSLSILVAVVVGATACSSAQKSPAGSPPADVGTPGPNGVTDGGLPSSPDAGNDPPAPFAPLPPHVYVGKVKSLLTGLPASEDELKAVVADARALRGLIDRWMATPEHRARLLIFFRQAFQQTQTDLGDYVDMFGTNPAGWDYARQLLASLEDSFALTALALIEQGEPWNKVVSTDRFMLNPPLMVLLAAMDALPRDDDNKLVRAAIWPLRRFPNLTLTRTNNPDPVTGMPVPIPYAETINPASPHFMHFFDPMPAMKVDDKPKCQEPQVVMGPQALLGFLELMWGKRPQACGATVGIFTPEDFDGWRMVRIRPPAGNEERTLFWELPKFRDPKTSELVLGTPRVGFMTTPAFFANWPTNNSNASRVTMNQSLIVALGRSFDDRGTTVQLTETSVESMHIQPGTACYACHQTLDPMRDFFRQSYAISYSQQLAPQKVPAQATFTVDDSPAVSGAGIGTLGRAMAEHPRFAAAWTQKLCQFANSETCDEDDPEFQRVARAFADSRFDWKTLVRELFSSPLVTFAATTKTAETRGLVLSITRREALCTLLGNRLELPDVCELGPTARRQSVRRNLAMAVPGAAYARGEETPLLPHDPNLFFASATDNLCGELAAALVDKAKGLYTSKQPAAAITDLVHRLMGLPPSDPRAAPMRRLLDEHHADALKAGATPADALRSTFIAACTSPFTQAQGL